MKKLTASDLRIGNLVRLFVGIDDNGAKYREYEIKGVMNMYNSSQYLIHNTWHNITDNLEPIKLTDRYLEILGFEEGSVGYYYKNGIIVSSDRQIYFGETETWIAELNFVHTLQNLYYALTREELTLKTQG